MKKIDHRIKDILEIYSCKDGEILREDSLKEVLGFDSLTLISVIMRLEQEFRFNATAEVIERLKTVEDLEKIVEELQSTAKFALSKDISPW